MPRHAVLLLPILLMACSAPLGPGPAPRPTAERDARTEACRAEATRIVQYRERGQTMRTDETESGRGTVTVAPFSRAETDRGMAQMERDRIMRECMGGTPAGASR
jgi:hypothetical protein